jgi:hypothetical protein
VPWAGAARCRLIAIISGRRIIDRFRRDSDAGRQSQTGGGDKDCLGGIVCGRFMVVSGHRCVDTEPRFGAVTRNAASNRLWFMEDHGEIVPTARRSDEIAQPRRARWWRHCGSVMGRFKRPSWTGQIACQSERCGFGLRCHLSAPAAAPTGRLPALQQPRSRRPKPADAGLAPGTNSGSTHQDQSRSLRRR